MVATLHSVSDLVSNEKSKLLQYKELSTEARWRLYPVNKDGASS